MVVALNKFFENIEKINHWHLERGKKMLVMFIEGIVKCHGLL